MPQLRNGEMTEDVRLGRLVQFDARSRSYPIRAALPSMEPRSYTWSTKVPALDQGSVGACVSYSMGNAALARPAPLKEPERLDHQFLLNVYCSAQRNDPWSGTDAPTYCQHLAQSPYYGGTSVLAGIKEYQQRGFFEEYRWSFSIEEAIVGIGRNGPAIVGTNWYSGLSNPSSDGRISVSGSLSGGHAYLICGVDVSGHASWLDGDVRVRNSWGTGWGDNGEATMSIRDLARLLSEDGECAFFLKRSTKPAVFR